MSCCTLLTFKSDRHTHTFFFFIQLIDLFRFFFFLQTVRIILGVFWRCHVHHIWIRTADHHRPGVGGRAPHVQLHQPETTDDGGHLVLRVWNSRTRLRPSPLRWVRGSVFENKYCKQ